MSPKTKKTHIKQEPVTSSAPTAGTKPALSVRGSEERCTRKFSTFTPRNLVPEQGVVFVDDWGFKGILSTASCEFDYSMEQDTCLKVQKCKGANLDRSPCMENLYYTRYDPCGCCAFEEGPFETMKRALKDQQKWREYWAGPLEKYLRFSEPRYTNHEELDDHHDRNDDQD